MNIKVELVDLGQDLLSFNIVHGKIKNANAQGRVWNNLVVANERLKPGDKIQFDDGETLNYPVKSLYPVE